MRAWRLWPLLWCLTLTACAVGTKITPGWR